MSACGWQASDFRAVLGRAPSNEFKERSQPCKVSSGCNRTRRSGAVLPRDLSPFDRLQFVGELDFVACAALLLLQEVEYLGLQDVAAVDVEVRGRGPLVGLFHHAGDPE